MARPRKYPDELVQRGVRIALEGGRPFVHIAHDLGIHPETLRKRVRRAEADGGKRTDLLSSQGREEMRRLRKENHELRRRTRSSSRRRCFSRASSTQTVRRERLRRREAGAFGVEPI